MSDFPRRVLVANRGEIARRVISTARRLGVESVAVFHPVDKDLPFVAEADTAIELASDVPVKAYLDQDQLIRAALDSGATAVHPGYGFLAENADFASAVTAAGLTWVGPSPESIVAMGDKIEARRVVAEAGVPISGGAGGALADVDEARVVAEEIGYPVMLKAAGGGGGIGMAVVHDTEGLVKAFAGTQSMAERSFGSRRVFVEKFVASARHVEVQILGLGDGTIVTLGERDCSAQRRHQKVLEESPAPHLAEHVRAAMADAAVRAAASVGYVNAGTVEFLLDTSTNEFVFLEMNTRIQVEHPVTELSQGVDIVEQQLSIAETGTTTPGFAPNPSGHAIEVRICAEDPERFFPRPGQILDLVEPTGVGVRVDAGYAAGTHVTPHFDSLVAKVIAHGSTRQQAIERVTQALDELVISGLTTNQPFLAQLLRDEGFVTGRYDTNVVGDLVKSIKARKAAGGRK